MAVVESRARGSYAKSTAVRQRALDACIEAFGIAGFHGATMKDIAARAGISHTGLLHHFANKEALLVAVLEYRDQRSTLIFENARVQLEATPRNSVRSMLTAVIANELEPGLAALHSTLSAEAASPDHPAYEYFRSRYRNLRAFYEKSFEEMTVRGELSISIPAPALATAFIALLDGLQVQWLYEQESMKMESILEVFLTAITVPARR